MLINLWASWCAPCVKELSDLTAHQGQLQGLDILALSVDDLSESDLGGRRAAGDVLKRVGFAFDAGWATASLVGKLELVHNELFSVQRPLPVPVSFLLDGQGDLAAVYRGPVEPLRLLADVARLSLEPERRRAAALPLPGRWYGKWPHRHLAAIARALVEAGYVADAVAYVARVKPELPGQSEWAGLLVYLGTALVDRGDLRGAEAHYRDALVADPNHQQARNNLGYLLLAAGRASDAVEHLHRAVTLRPDYVLARFSLARAYLALGRTQEAIDQLRQVVRLEPNDLQAQVTLGQALVQEGLYTEALVTYQLAVRTAPDSALVHRLLAELLATMPDLAADAVTHYRKAIALAPSDRASRNGLAWLLATHARAELRDGPQAVRQAEAAVAADGPVDPNLLDTLAAAYAESDQFEKAVATAQEAIGLAVAANRQKLATEIEDRLKRYRDGKPYRAP